MNEVIITRIDGASDSTVKQRDQLDHALGEAGALAEVDADVLSVRGREQQKRYRHPRRETDAGGEPA